VRNTAVHELIHYLQHPAFWAAFQNELTIVEGFTEYFAREVTTGERSSYPEPVEKLRAVRAAMKGPFHPSGHSAEAEESLRLAYFRGRLDLVGWRPSSPAEREAVQKAGGSVPWDPAEGGRREAGYEAGYRAEQDPHRNLIGVGLYFPGGTGRASSLALRYARVFARSEPYAKWQGLLEGQLVGSPIDPKALGASLGIAGEYQEPYFYLGAGLRVTGELAAADGAHRINLMPFGFAGVRLWQRVRIGAEGFVLVPVPAQKVGAGLGATVGVEF
jgi:hypothetical protein